MAIAAKDILVGDEVHMRKSRFVVTKITATNIHLDEIYKGRVVGNTMGEIENGIHGDNPHMIRCDFYRDGALVGSTDGRP